MRITLGVLLVCSLLHNNVAQTNNEPTMDKTMTMIKSMQKQSMGTPDRAVGQMVAQMRPDDERNPEEMGTYMEGDMLQTNAYKAGVKPMWPGGVVTYTIAADFKSRDLQHIDEAMREIEANTCIKFRRYTGRERDYIEITSTNTGCWSSVGRTGRKQQLNLQSPGCISGHGTPMHELLHALGFPHEHTRSDRDDYVRIRTANIEPGNLHNFRRTKFQGLGVKYDYGSIMHYGKFAFSKNNMQTIFPRRADANIGQRQRLSQSDIEEINRLYQCPNSITARNIETTTKRPNTWQQLLFSKYKWDSKTKKFIPI